MCFDWFVLLNVCDDVAVDFVGEGCRGWRCFVLNVVLMFGVVLVCFLAFVQVFMLFAVAAVFNVAVDGVARCWRCSRRCPWRRCVCVFFVHPPSPPCR